MRTRYPLLARVPSALAYLLQWWLAELKSALPLLAKILADARPRALLLAGTARTTLILQDAAAAGWRKEVFETALEEFSASQRARLQALCAQRELAVSLSAAEVYCLQLEIPRSGASNLHKLLQYRLLTESPLDAASMIFDARERPGDGKRSAGVADIALCRRQSVERLQACVEKCGLPRSDIGLAREDGIELEFAFLRVQGNGSSSSRRLVNLLLAFGPALICFLALSAVWAYAGWQEAGIRDDIASVSARAQDSFQLLARQAHTRAVRQAIHRDLPPISVSQLVNEVSKTLPKSAWLSEIRMEEHKLRLIGNGADPTAVATAISATAGLAAVRLDSVSAAAIADAAPRFEITAEIAEGKKQ